MRFTRSKFALAASLFTLALALISPSAQAQQVTYYDFDAPVANPAQVSRSCSTGVPTGTLFCFNDGTGANINPSFLSDTYPAIIDPVVTPGVAPVPSQHTTLQLTPAATSQSSSLWFTVPQKVAYGFTSYFAFKFTPDPASNGTADGLAFVIQNSMNPGYGGTCLGAGTGLSAIGGGGGCIGFGGIDNSLAIELDTYQNEWDPADIPSNPVNDNHVSIQNCGPGMPNSPIIVAGAAPSCEAILSSGGSTVPGFGIPNITLADGNVHQVVVEYSGPTEATPNLLRIYVDPTFVAGTHTPIAGSTPTIQGVYNIANNVNLINSGTANDSAYVGFTSATGSSDEQQQLLAWTFTPHTTVTLTQPLNPPGTPTTFPFGTHTWTVTYPSGGPSTQGIDMVVTANAITPLLFSQLIAGGPFAGSSCQVYDDTGGNCIVYSVSCVSDGTNTPVQCPQTTDPANPIVVKTAYNNTIQPVSPGLLQGDPFYTQVTSIMGTGSTATVTCIGECAVTAGQAITVAGSSIPAFNGPVVVGNVISPNSFTYSSTAVGTGNGGYLTSNNVQNIFYSYITQRVDGSTTGKTHTFSDFVATSVTVAPTMLAISAPTQAYAPTGTPAPTVTITATSGNGIPTGNILLSVDGKTATASAIDPTTGIASYSLTGITGGTHSLKATYAKNGNFQAATQIGSITITPISPTVTFTGAPATAPYKSTFTVTATTNASTKAVIKASGSCSISGTTVTITSGTGTCTLTADWAKDTNFTSAPEQTQTTNAMGEVTTVNLATPTPISTNLQAPVVLSFSVTGSPVIPTGAYTVKSSLAVDPTCAANLTSAGTGTCTLNFSTPGTRYLTISYLGNANLAPSSLPQIEVDVASVPLAGISPAAISFASIFQGAIKSQTVVLTNTGSLPMTVSNPYLTGLTNGSSPTNFVVINSCPSTLTPGQSCTMYVVFVAGPGATQTATLQIVDSAPNSPQSVPISATVVAPQLTLSPSPIAFGPQAVGTSSAAVPVTLANTGLNPALIAGISLVGPDGLQFSASNNCPRTLTAGQSCTINVTFSPTQAGAHATYLKVLTTTDTGTGFQQVPITGTAQ